MSMAAIALIGWGTLVGLDLVSVIQLMIARPLVAGTVAGIILGDPLGGGVVGAVLELFALGVLPVGASRYPDYGLGAIAGAATVANAPTILGTGIATLVGLLVAYIGGGAMQFVRRRNAADVRRHATAIDAGDPSVVAAVHYRGLGRDATRALVITAIGLLLAELATVVVPSLGGAVLMTVAAIGAAVGTALSGGMQLAGRGLDLRWLVVGLAVGTAWVVFA